MRKQLEKYILKEQLISPTESTLLAVSGGIDSMVLLHLFQEIKTIPFAVAHCNFKLRGEDSDLDEAFIKNYCTENNIKLFVKSFDTSTYAKAQGISIQMAARELRYSWFDEIAQKHQFAKIALAQHLDDQSETFFINLMRGTGIAGIHGILPKNGNLIRPLLFTDRKEIARYQQENSIPYREDKSNASDKYTRNYIRHHISPEFEKLAHGFSQKLDSNIKNFREVEDFYKSTINKNLGRIVNKEGKNEKILINDLLALDFTELHLREYLLNFGFNSDTIYKVYRQLKNPVSGKFFDSDTHSVLINREEIIIRRINKQLKNVFQLSANDSIEIPIILSTKIIDNKLTTYKASSEIAFLDLEKLKFPLTIRKWEKNDYFYPFGMNGKKKLSDFFIDQKLSKFQKEDLWLLISAEDIIWIIGYRTDNRYRITKNTKQILKITFEDGTN